MHALRGAKKRHCIFKHDVVCNASFHVYRFLCLFLNVFLFNSLLNNVKAETVEIF